MNKIMFMKSHFRKWLQSKEPDAIVGMAQSAAHCPLRNFMAEEIDKDTMIVTRDYARIWESKALSLCFTLPKFCTAFVTAVDNRFSTFVDVTAGQALEILETC